MGVKREYDEVDVVEMESPSKDGGQAVIYSCHLRNALESFEVDGKPADFLVELRLECTYSYSTTQVWFCMGRGMGLVCMGI